MIEFEERRHLRILPAFAAGAKVVARSTAVRDHRREAEGDELWPHQGPAGACAAPFATKALENLSFRCNAIAAIARSKAAAPLSRRFGSHPRSFASSRASPEAMSRDPTPATRSPECFAVIAARRFMSRSRRGRI